MPEAMVLVLEDGFTVFGARGGQATQAAGEVVINTCMTGYQEVLSDPSYAGQMVVMTYPLTGNYGATPDFQESGRPWARALITRQLSPFQQHWRTHQSLADWLDGYGVPILTGCDTRRLARHLRSTGAQRAIIGPGHELAALRERVQRVTPLEKQDLVHQVSEGFSDVDEALDPALAVGSSRQWTGLRVVVVDYGVKRNILRSLRTRGVEVEVLPHDSDLDMILARRPDAVVLSNGPGDPARHPARAGAWHLPRASARRPGGGRPHLTTAIRPPWRQPPRTRSAVRPGEHDVAEPRVRGRSRKSARRQRVPGQSSQLARWLGRGPGAPAPPRPLGAVPPRRRTRSPGQPGDLR